jgi:hypothetical protein
MTAIVRGAFFRGPDICLVHMGRIIRITIGIAKSGRMKADGP